MSNWQYANVTPIRQYRGANTLPREFKLFTGKDGQVYMSANVAPEVAVLRRNYKRLPDLLVANEREAKNVSTSKENAFEIEMDVTLNKAMKAGIVLYNDRGERVDLYLDRKSGRLVMDVRRVERFNLVRSQNLIRLKPTMTTVRNRRLLDHCAS